MATYYRGDCVVIGAGPDGNYPGDASLIGLRGTWQGTADRSFYYVAIPGRGQVMIEPEFVSPCPSPDDLVAS